MAATRPKLYGPTGQVINYGLYPSPRQNDTRSYRPRYYGSVQDTRKNLSQYDWWEMLNFSRQLFAQLGNLGGAIVQKNLWAFGDGWDPHFTGKNKDWGDEAGQFLRESFFPICNVRGEPYDFKTSLYLDGIAQDVDGDQLMIPTAAPSGFPMLQFLPAHCIGSWHEGDGDQVDDGVFKGAKIYNGIISDRTGRTVAYRIKDEEAAAGYRDVSTMNAQLLYEPEWTDQGRGIPRIARTLLDCFDTQDIDHFLKRGVKLDSAQGLLHTNERGEAVSGEDHVRSEEGISTEASPQKLDIEEVRGGEVLYFKAGVGEKLEAFKSDRPHPNTEAFVQRIERRIMFAIGWMIELIDPSEIGGASVRLITDLAKQSIMQRQKTGRKRWKRAITYAIARGMNGGFIPRNDDGGDAYRWEPGMPAEISVDAGNEEQADRENLKIGTTTLMRIAAKGGGHWSDLRAQTQVESEDLVDRALAMEKKYAGKLSFERALDILSKRDPNSQASAAAAQVAEPDPPKKKEGK